MTNTTELTISRTLKALGISPGLKGYKYLRYAIGLTMKAPDISAAITTTLYPEIAKTYGSSTSRVERVIRHAIEEAWTHGNLDVQLEIFGYAVKSTKGKPTNKEFIATVADYLLLTGGDARGS